MTKEQMDKIKRVRKDGVLVILRTFPFYRYAARINYIDEDTLKIWRDEDKDFSEQCEAARSEGIRNYSKRAAPEFMLAHAEPEVFRKDKENNININLSGMVQVITHDNDQPQSVAVEGTEEPKTV